MEFATAKLGAGNGAEYLKTKDVANIQQGLRGPMNAHLVGSGELETDVTEAINFLLEDGYRVQEMSSTTMTLRPHPPLSRHLLDVSEDLFLPRLNKRQSLQNMAG